MGSNKPAIDVIITKDQGHACFLFARLLFSYSSEVISVTVLLFMAFSSTRQTRLFLNRLKQIRFTGCIKHSATDDFGNKIPEVLSFVIFKKKLCPHPRVLGRSIFGLFFLRKQQRCIHYLRRRKVQRTSRRRKTKTLQPRQPES